MNGSEDNGFLIRDLWVRNFFLRYCATTLLEEYSSGMCVVFAERVSEISFGDDLDRRALALERRRFFDLCAVRSEFPQV